MHSRHYTWLLAAAAIVLTSKENGTLSQTDFFCSGKIHGYIRLPSRQEGKHSLEGIWTLPTGKVLQHSNNTVDFPPPGRTTAYIWLQFPARSTLSINPAADQERLSYNGEWKVDVRWDDKPIIHSTFSVTCQ